MKPKKPRKITLDKDTGIFIQMEPSGWVLLADKFWINLISLEPEQTKKLYNWLTKQQAYAKSLKGKK